MIRNKENRDEEGRPEQGSLEILPVLKRVILNNNKNY